MQKVLIVSIIVVTISIFNTLPRQSQTHPNASQPANSTDTVALTKLNKTLGTIMQATRGSGFITCTPSDLYKDYDKNEVAADSKYKGRSIMVTGIVSSVSTDFGDNIYITLSIPRQIAEVRADLASVQPKDFLGNDEFTPQSVTDAVLSVTKGQVITLLGIGKGRLIGYPRLEQCVVITPELQDQIHKLRNKQ